MLKSLRIMPTNFPAHTQDQVMPPCDGKGQSVPRDEQVHDLRRRVCVYVYARDSCA